MFLNSRNISFFIFFTISFTFSPYCIVGYLGGQEEYSDGGQEEIAQACPTPSRGPCSLGRLSTKITFLYSTLLLYTATGPIKHLV